MIRSLLCLATLAALTSTASADDSTLITLSAHAAQVRAIDALCLAAQQRHCDSVPNATSSELQRLRECDLLTQLESFDAVDQMKFYFGQRSVTCTTLVTSSTSVVDQYAVQTVCRPGQQCSQVFMSPEMMR